MWLYTRVSLVFGGREYLQDTDLTVQVVQWNFSHIITLILQTKSH